MFPIVVANNIWGASLKNKNILFHSDNQAVVAILDKKTSKSERVMALVRNFVLFTLKHNILFRAQYVEGVLNVIADSLPRCDFQLFRALCPTADSHPSQIPAHLWNIWIQK